MQKKRIVVLGAEFRVLFDDEHSMPRCAGYDEAEAKYQC